eukprot:scaffold5502_cov115-Isochrysis_galbana.AAC.11
MLDDSQLYGPESAGYSRQKVSFLRQLCAAARQGKLAIADLCSLSDAALSARLLSLHGIGEWCAGVAMMHTLRRADVMLYGENSSAPPGRLTDSPLRYSSMRELHHALWHASPPPPVSLSCPLRYCRACRPLRLPQLPQ